MHDSRITAIFAAALITFGFAGCASTSAPPATPDKAQMERQAKLERQAEQVADAKREQRAIAAVNPANSVFFETNSANVDARARETLRVHAERLKGNPKQKVLLVGFTDDRGSSSYNNAIAEMRVNAVYKALRELGVKPGQLRRYSAGGEKNSTACTSDQCRALMRRVELDYSVK